MKKIFALVLIAVMILTTAAFAETYRYKDDIAFNYDETLFNITTDDHTDDEDLVILTSMDEKSFVRIHLADLDDGEKFPTLADFKDIEEALNVKVEQLDAWAGYKNVFTYTADNEDGTTETSFIAPVYDDDGEIDGTLAVRIGVEKNADEEAAMARDDAISEIVNTLRVDA